MEHSPGYEEVLKTDQKVFRGRNKRQRYCSDSEVCLRYFEKNTRDLLQNVLYMVSQVCLAGYLLPLPSSHIYLIAAPLS